MQKVIIDFFKNLKLGKEIRYKNMIIFPIISKEKSSQQFLTIDEALAKDVVNVTEMSDMGDVPNLKLKNLGKQKIFILDGEELIGAKQNRVTNTVVLVPEEKELTIPVSCVERNRWNYKTKRFYSGNTRVYFRLRKKIFESTLNNKERNIKNHPQHDVWNDIDNKMYNMNVESTTNAMNDIYKKYIKKLEGFNKKFSKEEEQVGMIVVINNKVLSCELFSNSNIMNNLYDKILNSYVIDAIEEYKGKVKTLKTIRRRALNFLDNIKNSSLRESNSVGLGKDIVLDSDKICGSALKFNGKIVYMSVYSKTTN
jgi:hypothetical protein